MNAVQSQLSVSTITADQSNFTNATSVISSTQKFVVPVPAFSDGGEPLVYPIGDKNAGETILDWNNRPIGENGVVFWNAKDSCWQAVPSDGGGVVIINQVSEAEAAQLCQRFAELGGPHNMTLEGFKRFLEYATSVGLNDAYNSDTEYVRANMTPAKEGALQIETSGLRTGFMKRDDRAIAQAIYKEGPFVFENVKGVRQDMPNGGVIVRLGDSVHAVQPDIFRQTYRLAEGGRQIQDVAADIKNARLS